MPHEMRTRVAGMPTLPPSTTSSLDLIVNPTKIYIFRLALCITPTSFSNDFGNNKSAVYQWWNEMEQYLESVYRDAVGIRFQVVRNEKLIMAQNDTGFEETLSNGTKIINQLIGQDAYEVGILMKYKDVGGNGSAYLRGVTTHITKGMAWAIKNPSTIAHEVGHLFGAVHTHQRDDGNYTEPGFGQSIMSYGQPRRCFSLASIKTMRHILTNMGYYTHSDRHSTYRIEKNNGYNENIPVVEEETATIPQLDQEKIRSVYRVTKGTYFQFYLPVKNDNPKNFFFQVHPFDVVSKHEEPNALQPVYEPTSDANIMFQPYYAKPPQVLYHQVPQPISYSDNFKIGTYRFLAAVSSGSNYDSKLLELHIVEGDTFRITGFTGRENNTWGEHFTLTWNPCKALYGEQSKVRIWLSEDFGQTFPYLLADDVPNTGQWQGTWPHIYISNTTYRDLPQPIRGGMLKIEVKGEAAFDIYPRLPYEYEGQYVQYTGGFTIDSYQARIQFANPPSPFLTIATTADLPPMPTLRARHKQQPSRWLNIEGKQTQEGRIIRRTWKAEMNGDIQTYHQIFLLPELAVDNAAIVNEAKDLQLMANTLYLNGGKMGYPNSTVAPYMQFRMMYEKVYADAHTIHQDVSQDDVANLRNSMMALAQLPIDDIIQPQPGQKYRLRNYQNVFGRPRYWYVQKNATGEIFTKDSLEATLWQVEKVGNAYVLKDNTAQQLQLEGFTSGTGTIILDRAYSWGSFTLLNKQGHSLQLHQKGLPLSINTDYMDNPLSYRVNNNGLPLSTDFEWVLDTESSATAIHSIPSNHLNEVQVYDLMGRKQQHISKGIYIIKDAQGHVRKVYCK